MSAITAEDRNWLEVASVIARRSRCVRSQVGCVIVGADGRIVATGYNGAAAGFSLASAAIGSERHKPRCDRFCPRAMPGGAGDASTDYGNCVAVHAEANALLHASRAEVVGATIYTTRMPCWECCKLISNSGIVRVVCPNDGSDSTRVMWNADEVLKYHRYLVSCGVHVDKDDA